MEDGNLTSGALVDKIRERNPGWTKENAETSMNAVLGAISALVAAGEKVIIRGFGTFSMKHVPQRNGRNPRTGEPLVTAAHDKVAFKPAKRTA